METVEWEATLLDRLCQVGLHRWSSVDRRVLFLGSPPLPLTRHSIDSAMRIPLANNNHDFPPFLSLVQSLFHSCYLYSSTTASRQRGRRVTACLRIRASLDPRPKKKKLTQLLLHSGPHNIPCPSTFLLARATAVVLALTPR